MKIEKLYPECKDYIWGGERLKKEFNKKSDKDIIAETWELSFREEGLTKLKDGKTLKDVVKNEELGENALDFPFFPTLIKLIDAKNDLSVQVHPSDSYALKNENSFGKTEMWYIVDATKDAGIYLGFNKDVSKKEFEDSIKNKELTSLLNFYPVKSGDCFFIPSGTIHAIGKGCLICEIQQNSNLTYRVYDYGRKDKFGKERELHVDKALKVTSLSKFTANSFKTDTKENYLGVSKYFTVKKVDVLDKLTLFCDNKSFKSITVVKGKGSIGSEKVSMGDTVFVPASFGEFEVKGNLELITTEIRKYYIGIDLGGTFIKGGIVDDTGKIIISDKIPTEKEKGDKKVALNICKLAKILLNRLNLNESDVVGMGIGVPGMIDRENGNVKFSNNLMWEDFNIVKNIKEVMNLDIKIANDADVAALGEATFGSGKDYKHSVMITLGTGVGSGIVINKKLYSGNCSAGAELGHMVIVYGGEKCTCGRRGCLEAYASATALIRETKKAIKEHKDSKMCAVPLSKVDGKTAFDYRKTDKYAKQVVDNYISYLACGLTNIANVFRPEVIILGGGVCAEKDNLIIPLKKIMAKEIFAGDKGPEVPVIIASLGNSAGLLGAAALLME